MSGPVLLRGTGLTCYTFSATLATEGCYRVALHPYFGIGSLLTTDARANRRSGRGGGDPRSLRYAVAWARRWLGAFSGLKTGGNALLRNARFVARFEKSGAGSEGHGGLLISGSQVRILVRPPLIPLCFSRFCITSASLRSRAN